jgi:hypothetical protein
MGRLGNESSYREGGKIESMAKLTLVYGMRLLPADEIEEVGEAAVKLKNGRQASVTLHIVEGSKEDIEKQLRQSIDAFFDLYPEI